MQAPLNNQNRWENTVVFSTYSFKNTPPKVPQLSGVWGESSGASAMFVAFSASSSHGYSSFMQSMLQNQINQNIDSRLFEMFSLLDRFVVLRVILYSHPNKVFSVINGLIFQVLKFEEEL